MTVEFPPNTRIGRNALAVLASLPLFEDLEPAALVAVAEHVEWFCIPGGATLFDQGDEADSLYAVSSGALGAYRDGPDGRRLIAENSDIVAVAPYAPRFPFETWLLPRRHQSLFEDAARHEYASLARLLRDILRRMNKALRFPPYNLLIHSAPVVEPAGEYYHWHVEIIPKLTKVAGFEWATGFYLNPTAPEEAAQVLREARA